MYILESGGPSSSNFLKNFSRSSATFVGVSIFFRQANDRKDDTLTGVENLSHNNQMIIVYSLAWSVRVASLCAC